VLPQEAAKLQPTDVDQPRYAARARNGSGFVFLHNFQDHVATHDLADLQIVLQTKDGELRIPSDTKFALKNEAAAIFPFNLDFGGVKVRYATAQPLASLPRENGAHYAFVAIDGIEPEFAFDSKKAQQIQSKDCRITNSADLAIVHCPANAVSEFTVENEDGQPVTFAVFPKSMALKAWLVDTKKGKTLLFSDSVILSSPDGIDAYNIGSNAFSFAAYPSLPEAPKHKNVAVTSTSAAHPSMSAYSLTSVDAEPFVHSKVVDRKTVTVSSDGPTLPEGIDDVFLDIDYTGDVGLAFINGELVDDHFYFGQPWRIGLKRFLPRVSEGGMYLSFRPIYKDAPYLADLPASAVPDFSKDREILRINQVKVLPEYKASFSF
jgi:hypothetical protein